MTAVLRPAADPTAAADRRAAVRSTLASAAVNAALTVAQIGVGWVAHSQALIADGVHSLSDLLSDGVVLFATTQGTKAADAEHPYGHRRFETGATLALGALLCAVGAGLLWGAVRTLEQAGARPPVELAALWVALATLVAKEALFRYLMRVARRVQSSMLAANAWHSRSDAASSLVVVVGIGASLLGVPLADPLAALIVGFLVVRMGWTFGWGALAELMDHAAADEEVRAIRATIAATPGVLGVHDLRTRKMGDLVLVDAHLEVDGSITVEQGHAIATAARDRVMARHRVLNVMTHVDPVRVAKATN